ncbi:MAG TPA: NADPH-dependent glutamate synthase [Candidatus Desulfovibrio intestinipullorum]|uniref:NADPH-dependent glutamate synthase n=1 Tax=Candidatus Desulfovibrio intestinipullorum TaxID=2838536 RepID=A0A9D1PXP2_9BACT|nr:NADPH-dependent glutamate synthase [Candidatus Desulfovibrio intestinipullorum]
MDKQQKKSRAPMPCQPPHVRNHNFDEVALGYDAETAREEASRCLQCKKPLCVSGCPVNVPIPEFIHALREGNPAEAYRLLKTANALPAVCGRVCPQEHQCEGKCILGRKGEPVAIGRLERFVADTHIAASACEQQTGTSACATPVSNLSVACIGSGPASLSCAGYCASQGLKVHIYEALHEAGGVLIYGIPSFRLPKDVVRNEVNALKELGVELHLDAVGGRTFQISELLKKHDAIFIGVGAGLPKFLGVPGENIVGVFSANEYLTRINLGRAYQFPAYDTPAYHGRIVTVFGAGNVAMDAARTALRMGAEEVHVCYRRTRAEMPARHEEVEHAEEEGVIFDMLVNPVAFHADENQRLRSVTLQRMELGEPDDSGRRRPVAVEGSDFEMKTDLAIVALGTRSNPILLEATEELEKTKWGYIKVNEETGETSIPNVFAGGDIVTGAATVILAAGAGRKAGISICERLLNSAK